MKKCFKNNIYLDNLFSTRMDFHVIKSSKISFILNHPAKWQIVEFSNPFEVVEDHIPGSVIINKLNYESSLNILNKRKKTLINGAFFENTFYYHFLKSNGFNVYLIKNKPSLFKYKKIKIKS